MKNWNRTFIYTAYKCMCVCARACVYAQFACQQLFFSFLASLFTFFHVFSFPPVSLSFTFYLSKGILIILKKTLLSFYIFILHFICTNYKCHERWRHILKYNCKTAAQTQTYFPYACMCWYELKKKKTSISPHINAVI